MVCSSPASAMWGGTGRVQGREAAVPAGTLLVPWTSLGWLNPEFPAFPV